MLAQKQRQSQILDEQTSRDKLSFNAAELELRNMRANLMERTKEERQIQLEKNIQNQKLQNQIDHDEMFAKRIWWGLIIV